VDPLLFDSFFFLEADPDIDVEDGFGATCLGVFGVPIDCPSAFALAASCSSALFSAASRSYRSRISRCILS